ncbi:MAG: hypothetical protein AB2535_13865 [Candidatus Thiodiazotropha endolucinida]
MLVTRRNFFKGMGPLAAFAAASGGFAGFPSVGSAQNGRRTAEEIVKPTCAHCVNFYGIELHKTGNVIRSILPNPDPGRREYFNHSICSKRGCRGLHSLQPLPGEGAAQAGQSRKKGPNVDPKWVGISWREA